MKTAGMWAALYRVLLLAFPGHIRRRFGDDMARMFEDQLRDARARRERAVYLWWHAAGDALYELSPPRS